MNSPPLAGDERSESQRFVSQKLDFGAWRPNTNPGQPGCRKMAPGLRLL